MPKSISDLYVDHWQPHENINQITTSFRDIFHWTNTFQTKVNRNGSVVFGLFYKVIDVQDYVEKFSLLSIIISFSLQTICASKGFWQRWWKSK